VNKNKAPKIDPNKIIEVISELDKGKDITDIKILYKKPRPVKFMSNVQRLKDVLRKILKVTYKVPFFGYIARIMVQVVLLPRKAQYRAEEFALLQAQIRELQAQVRELQAEVIQSDS